jgi:hypothetical protein
MFFPKKKITKSKPDLKADEAFTSFVLEMIINIQLKIYLLN